MAVDVDGKLKVVNEDMALIETALDVGGKLKIWNDNVGK
jgi:hypothetical protein